MVFKLFPKTLNFFIFILNFYSQEHESGVRYDDPLIAINWPLDISSISDRDKNHQLLPDHFEGIEI